MANPPDPSNPNGPAPHYEQPNWQVQQVVNAQHVTMTAPERPAPPAPPPDPNRTKMLWQVRWQWVEGVLHKSLWNEARIALRLAEGTARPYNVELQEPERPPVLLPQDTPITEVYDKHQYQNLLVILGEPGGGKTTLLLELADQLLGRAEADAAHPIPVVFNLSTWGKDKPTIHDWMVDQLHLIYYVPPDIGKIWVTSGQILPLLDGLDEVAVEWRAACLEAIKTYRGNHVRAWATPMVLCCRSEEYHTLPHLQGATAITVQVLTRAEIDVYLDEGGQHLDGVRAVLKDDHTLYDLLKIPLLLSTIALAFADTSAEDLRTATTPELRKQAIFAAFVRRMFATEPPGKGEDDRYPRRRILRGLRWLARRLDANSRTLYQMELMQPDWLEGWAPIIVRWSAALALGLCTSLLVGMSNYANSFFWAVASGVLFTLISGWLSLRTHTIKVTDRFYWSWDHFYEERRNFLTVMLVIFLCSLIAGMFVGWDYMLVGVLINLFIFGFGGGLNIVLRSEVFDKRIVPNEGIRNSIHTMRRSGLFVGLGCGTFAGISIGLLVGWGNGVLFGVLSGVIVGIAISLLFGLTFALQYGGTAVIQHYTLRLFLLQSGAMPWDIAAMLDAAARRSLLRRVGGGWVFTHRMLLEYFRDLSDEGLEELVKP